MSNNAHDLLRGLLRSMSAEIQEINLQIQCKRSLMTDAKIDAALAPEPAPAIAAMPILQISVAANRRCLSLFLLRKWRHQTLIAVSLPGNLRPLLLHLRKKRKEIK